MKTEYLTEPRFILDSSVVAVGSFDGLHRGHRAVLERLLGKAKALAVSPVVLTFEPHPRAVLGKSSLKLLTPLDEKIPAIAAMGIDFLIVVGFDMSFAGLTSEKFVEEYLVKSLGIKALILGTDHGFGKNRSGGVESLRGIANDRGFELEIVEPVLWKGEHIRSNRIREAVAEGSLSGTAHMLGRPYMIAGEVVRGRGRGKEMGYPTVNISPPEEKLLPPSGVYAASDDKGTPGLLYIGTSPTFDDGQFTVEFYCVREMGLSIGDEARISVFEYFRGERAFPSKMELIEQIEKDKEKLEKWVKIHNAK